MMPLRTEPSDLVRSVSRALRVLEEVGAHPEGVNAKRLATRCELNLSTTYHLLRTLAYEGYLERLPSGDYVLGLNIADRFRDLASTLTHPPAVQAVLRELAATTGHSAYLGRFVNGRVTITQVVESPGSPHLEDLIVGFDEAAHATALGKALLSTLPARRRQQYLAETGLRRFTAYTISERDAFEAELESPSPAAQMFGETEQYRRGVGCVAALVRRADDADGWWAVALSFAVDRMRPRERLLAEPLSLAAGDLADTG